MQLNELYKQFKDYSSHIASFKEGRKEDVDYDIDVLANAFCNAVDTKNEANKTYYLSALIIRYWHLIFYYKNKSANVPVETIFEWITDGILNACKYRGWLRDSKLLNNRRGAEICINNAIDTARKRFYTYSNASKRKNYFFKDSIQSLDCLESFELDSCLSVEDDSIYPLDVEIVNNLLSNNKVLEGIIIDKIINENCYKSSSKLNNSLKSINESYLDYFTNKYDVKDYDNFYNIVKKLSQKKNRSLSYLSNKIIKNLRNMQEIKEIARSY